VVLLMQEISMVPAVVKKTCHEIGAINEQFHYIRLTRRTGNLTSEQKTHVTLYDTWKEFISDNYQRIYVHLLNRCNKLPGILNAE
jgi:hypothetical protein